MYDVIMPRVCVCMYVYIYIYIYVYINTVMGLGRIVPFNLI